MRLGQLSRKLEVESSTIVKVLKEHFREVNNHPNVKILDEEYDFLLNRFGPKPLTPAEESSIEIPIEPKEVIEETEAKDASPKKETPVFVESLRPRVITLESEFDQKKRELESYKAEKPELEGLKVVGKIELPEPKPKAPKVDNKDAEGSEGTKTVDERNLRPRNKRKDNRQRVNRSPAEERKRAEQLANRRKAQEERQLKELKKKHYEENVKAKLEKPKRKKKKKFVQQFEATIQQDQVQKQPQKSSNPLVRFWRWLNGDYDKFQ